jgi:hypothetical protein
MLDHQGHGTSQSGLQAWLGVFSHSSALAHLGIVVPQHPSKLASLTVRYEWRITTFTRQVKHAFDCVFSDFNFFPPLISSVMFSGLKWSMIHVR